MRSNLEINKLTLEIPIGVGDEERAKPQKIEFNISISFTYIPIGCHSGNIDDTICYAKLLKSIKLFCLNKEFYLIEQLTFSLHEHLKRYMLNSEDVLKLQVCKAPPLKEIKDNCCFTVIG